MIWVKGILLVIAWLIAYAVMKNWPPFDKMMLSAVFGLVYYCYTTGKEVDKLRLRLDRLVDKLDGRSD